MKGKKKYVHENRISNRLDRQIHVDTKINIDTLYMNK